MLVRLTDECAQGRHQHCAVGQAAPPGVFGGWKCSCVCHSSTKPYISMSEQISPEAREAAKREYEEGISKPIEKMRPLGAYVQALLDSIHRQHSEEMAKLKSELMDRKDDVAYWSALSTRPGPAATITSLREQLRAKEERPRTERCCECGGYVSDWVEADHRNGRICKPCEALVTLRAENERLKGELERAWITQGDLREQSEVLKDKMEGLRSQLEAVTAQRDELEADRERLRAAALRFAEDKYLAWGYAGGLNDCAHGYGEGIPCRKCDEATIRAARKETL